jgi:threonine/homoserine/homoserine lactone efflux protein
MAAMDFSFLLKGVLLGFSIAAPVGPIGVLCIRRTISNGRASGLVSGLGAATADALYGCIAGFGLTLITSLMLGLHFWLNLLGGLFLCSLGIRTFLSRPAGEAARAGEGGLLSDYLSTLALTLTNPMTILSFAATFAGLGIASQQGPGGALSPLVSPGMREPPCWCLACSQGPPCGGCS